MARIHGQQFDAGGLVGAVKRVERGSKAGGKGQYVGGAAVGEFPPIISAFFSVATKNEVGYILGGNRAVWEAMNLGGPPPICVTTTS